MNKTEIEWCDYSWNPVVGCSPASEGCANCYAAAIAHRFGLPWGMAVFKPERLGQPAKTKRPSRVFVCSMGDLFHETVADDWIRQVFNAMHPDLLQPSPHTFIILTKRPTRMRDFFAKYTKTGGPEAWPNVWLGVTVENQARAEERIPVLLSIPAAVRFVSVEPMLGPVNLCALRDGSWHDAEGADLYERYAERRTGATATTGFPVGPCWTG